MRAGHAPAPRRRAAAAGLVLLAMAGAAPSAPRSDGPPDAPPAEVLAALPTARLVGQGSLRWFGFTVYEARLWAAEGFDALRFDASPFALELRYLRRLDGEAIAERALDEMRRGGPIADADASAWRAAMRAAFPDVSPGDRLTGLHDPLQGARFHLNGRVTAAIGDAGFARRFYAIWLGTHTSQPALRTQLIGAPR
jgi:hypothetical protein